MDAKNSAKKDFLVEKKALWYMANSRNCGRTAEQLRRLIAYFAETGFQKLNIEVTCKEIQELQEEIQKLREALRKGILWAECASMKLENRNEINWTYLNDAREALKEGDK